MGIKLVKINKIALAITLGLIYGIILLTIGLLSWLTGWGKDIMVIYASFFPGLAPTITGSVIGAIWGIVFGAIFGYVIAVLYNYFDQRIKA